MTNNTTLTRQDFASDQNVRWCPGCGDYAILASVQRVCPSLGVAPHNMVFVSGIGCAARFPYYMNTYGFHTIHGRAPAFATGIKVANPDLMVWVVTGDGDALSIGGNHFIHVIRRNLNINYLLFNNRIYGLTKGQYSPTSEKGKKTKTSPYGSVETPLNPIKLALSSEGTFIARAIDRNVKHLENILLLAAQHKGTSFVEIYQNCNIFNDNAFIQHTDRSILNDHSIFLEHQKPLIFGKDDDKGIVLDKSNLSFKVVNLKQDGVSVNELFYHDAHDASPIRCYLYSLLDDDPTLPTPFGVFRQIQKPCYDEEINNQVKRYEATDTKKALHELLHSGATWSVD